MCSRAFLNKSLSYCKASRASQNSPWRQILCCRQNMLQMLLQTFSFLLGAACNWCYTLLHSGGLKEEGGCGISIRFPSSQLFSCAKTCILMESRTTCCQQIWPRTCCSAVLHSLSSVQTRTKRLPFLHSSECSWSIREQLGTHLASMIVTIPFLCSSGVYNNLFQGNPRCICSTKCEFNLIEYLEI